MQQPSGDQGYQAKPMGRKSCLQKPDLTLNQLMLWGITPAHLDNQPTCWDPFAVVPFSPGFGPRAQCVTPWLLRQDIPFPLLLSKVQISPIGIAALEHHSLLKAVVTGPQ